MDRIRTFFRYNVMLKAAAFLLAIIIWAMVHDAISTSQLSPSLPEESWTLTNVPVRVLTPANFKRDVVLAPETASVVVKGPPRELQRVRSSQVTLYVNVAPTEKRDVFDAGVQYSIRASGVQVDQIVPRDIKVELH